jgi:hypothetical protein
MIESWLRKTAADFWQTLGCELPYPRTLMPALSRSFPLSVFQLPQLSISQVETWLLRQHIPFRFLCQDRALCGCVVAAHGYGLIFIDSLDEANEQRYTLAHEISHFLLDYLYPRRRALDLFGETIRPVLDGERPPTQTERVHAVLSSMTLTIYLDFMPRSPQRTLDQGYILRAENKADRLALEILAPFEHVLSSLATCQNIIAFPERLSMVTHLLTSTYGLPPAVAQKYSSMLLPPPRQGSTARWLGLI